MYSNLMKSNLFTYTCGRKQCIPPVTHWKGDILSYKEELRKKVLVDVVWCKWLHPLLHGSMIYLSQSMYNISECFWKQWVVSVVLLFSNVHAWTSRLVWLMMQWLRSAYVIIKKKILPEYHDIEDSMANRLGRESGLRLTSHLWQVHSITKLAA